MTRRHDVAVVNDWAAAATELSGLCAWHRVAFVAAAVQRGAARFTDQIRRRRSDHEFFTETVDFLWAVTAGAEPTALPARSLRPAAGSAAGLTALRRSVQNEVNSRRRQMTAQARLSMA